MIFKHQIYGHVLDKVWLVDNINYMTQCQIISDTLPGKRVLRQSKNDIFSHSKNNVSFNYKFEIDACILIKI